MKRILTILTAAFLAVTLCLGSSACTFGRRDPGEIGDTENEETLPPVDPAQLPGIVAGRVYINRFFGLRLDLDSKWTMMTEEELEKMNHEAVEALPGGYSSAAEGTDYFCDMSASANGGFHAIRVVVQNLHGGDANITEKVIAEQTALVISESYGNSGYTDIVCTIGKATVCGTEHESVLTEAKINGIPFYQKSVVMMKNGCYASVNVSSYSENVTDDLLALFTSAG